MDGLAIMGCSDDTLKTLGITKFGDIAVLRGSYHRKSSWVLIADEEEVAKRNL